MTENTFNLSGKVALVTGGSRGIGLALCEGLAQSGADIAIIARDKGQLAQAKGRIEDRHKKKVWTFAFDLTETDKIGPLFEEIIPATGGIDILVNCAGTTHRAPAEELPIDRFEQVIKTNLTAAFAISQQFCIHRKKTGKAGKIINIGSLMCHGARPTTAAYAASKGGLLMLTKTLAVEWAKYNINVNAIGPGYIDTELTRPLQQDADFNKWVLSKTPLARWGQTQDLIGTAVFLASGASDFVTGQIIYVDGGWLAAL